MCRYLSVLAHKVIISRLSAPTVQRSLCSAGYSLACVSLCSAYCSSTTFLCDTILMEEELLHFPRLPNSFTWIAPDTPVREACSSLVPMMRNATFLVIQMLAYHFNHLCLLHKQRQQSDRGSYLAKMVVNISCSCFCRLYMCRQWKLLTIVLLKIYTIHQAEFPGLIVHCGSL